jgi:hypothetical protein
MTKKTSLGWSDIKKKLDAFDRAGLTALVKDLYNYSSDNKSFLSARFADQSSGKAILEDYKERITKQFFPKRGLGKLDLREARRAISEYSKATSDTRGKLDLMFTYISTGVDFIQNYGDGPESLYDSMLSLLEEAVKILQSPEGENLYPEFEDELNTLVKTSGDTGYGFEDEVKSLISELKVVMGKD